MRVVLVSLIAVACGKGAVETVAAGSDKPVGSDKPPRVDPPPVAPTIVAVTVGDHLKLLALTPAGITVTRDVKLPALNMAVSWLDREHLVAVDLEGGAYLVTGDSVAAYKMPPARAWMAKPGAGETAATFPRKLTLSRTAEGVELASCETYYQGDDDPCVTWGSVTLGPSLEVGAVTRRTDGPGEDAIEPEVTPTTAAPTIAWTDNSDGMHTSVALKLGAAHREWSSVEPCPLVDARIKWLSATPPILSFITTSDCGEGGPNDEEHLLRVPTLVDFGPVALTLIVGPSLWARSTTDTGWTLFSGERVVGALEGPPMVQPSADPIAPAVPPDVGTNHLALRRGERLRVPSVETDWKTPAGTMHATVVDLTFKQVRNKAPISKLVVWSAKKRFDIVRSLRACDAFAEVRPVKDMLVYRCGSRPADDEPEGMIEDWLVRWSSEKKAPLRRNHWTGDPAAAEPAWAK